MKQKLETPAKYFVIRNKRCKVSLNDQNLIIQSELTPNSRCWPSVFVTARKCPEKLVCACIQAHEDRLQQRFHNHSLTNQLINGNFTQQTESNLINCDQQECNRQNIITNAVISASATDALSNNCALNFNEFNQFRMSRSSTLPDTEDCEDGENSQDTETDDGGEDSGFFRQLSNEKYKDTIDLNAENNDENIKVINQPDTQKLSCNEEDLNNLETKLNNLKNIDNVNNLTSLDNEDINFIEELIEDEEDFEEISEEPGLNEHVFSDELSETSIGPTDLMQPIKLSLTCVRLYYALPVASFNYKVKYLNLVPDPNQPIIKDDQSEEVVYMDTETLENSIRLMVQLLQDKLQEFNRPKTLLLFINPVGGKKRAPIIYKKVCKPLLAICGIKTHVIYTQKANHAFMLLNDQRVDLSMYNALGCVGGDGMFSEILNGMLRRDMQEEEEDESRLDEGLADEQTAEHTEKQGKGAFDTQISNESSTGEDKFYDANENPTGAIRRKSAIDKLLELTQQHPLSRYKLGVRYSLPCNGGFPQHSVQTRLNNSAFSKRHSLPVFAHQTQMDTRQERPSQLPILIVPAGSTDAVAYASNGINDPQTVLINFLLGKQIKIDVAAIHSIEDDNRLIKFCSSFLGYGYFGDILRDSEENLRWMGPKRYDWAGLKKFFLHKIYRGELSLKVSLLDGDPKEQNICTSNCQLCSKSFIRSLFSNEQEQSKLNSPLRRNKDDNNNNNPEMENLENDENNLNVNNINNKNTINKCNNNQIAITSEQNGDSNMNYISIKGRFLAINAAIMPCRCGHSKYGISPSQHIGNGCCDLIVIAQCTRKDYLKYLIRTGFSEKSVFDLDYVNVYRVKEFTFKPVYDLTQTPSVWNCDGEILQEAAINVKIHCQMVSVFGSGVEMRPTNKNLVKKEKMYGSLNSKFTMTNKYNRKESIALKSSTDTGLVANKIYQQKVIKA